MVTDRRYKKIRSMTLFHRNSYKSSKKIVWYFETINCHLIKIRWIYVEKLWREIANFVKCCQCGGSCFEKNMQEKEMRYMILISKKILVRWNNKLSFIKIRFVHGEKYGRKLPIWWKVNNVGEVVLRKICRKKKCARKFWLEFFFATERTNTIFGSMLLLHN